MTLPVQLVESTTIIQRLLFQQTAPRVSNQLSPSEDLQYLLVGILCTSSSSMAFISFLTRIPGNFRRTKHWNDGVKVVDILPTCLILKEVLDAVSPSVLLFSFVVVIYL